MARDHEIRASRVETKDDGTSERASFPCDATQRAPLNDPLAIPRFPSNMHRNRVASRRDAQRFTTRVTALPRGSHHLHRSHSVVVVTRRCDTRNGQRERGGWGGWRSEEDLLK